MINRLLMLAMYGLATVSRGLPAATDTSDVASFVGQIHQLNWLTAESEYVKANAPLRLTSQVPGEGISSPADACDSVLYLNGIAGQLRVTVEFDEAKQEHGCRQVLDGIAINGTVSNADAELLSGKLLRELRPGGKPRASVNDLNYEWRSRDSLTRYNLYISIHPASRKPTPATLARFKAILKHQSVRPVDVDDLPFEKGFFADCPK